jgi:hypothetical protein
LHGVDGLIAQELLLVLGELELVHDHPHVHWMRDVPADGCYSSNPVARIRDTCAPGTIRWLTAGAPGPYGINNRPASWQRFYADVAKSRQALVISQEAIATGLNRGR